MSIDPQLFPYNTMHRPTQGSDSRCDPRRQYNSHLRSATLALVHYDASSDVPQRYLSDLISKSGHCSKGEHTFTGEAALVEYSSRQQLTATTMSGILARECTSQALPR